MNRVLVACVVVVGSVAYVVAGDAHSFESANEHLQKGRYEEALEAFESLEEARQDAARIALGRSQAYQCLGDWQHATDVLQAAIAGDDKSAVLRARLAEVLFLRGRYDEAEKAVNDALQRDPEQPLAHLVQADLFTETGRIKEATDAYRWFVRYYNRAQPEDAETLMIVARGAAQYARWAPKSQAQIFGFAVNTLCPDALKNDADHWQAQYISGLLLLEKYNQAQAMPEFDKALAINPRASQVLIAKGSAALQDNKLKEAEEFADQVLQVDAKQIEALQLKADVKLNSGRLAEARELLEQAAAVNPHEQRTLGRLAACFLLEDGLPPADEWEQLLSNVEAIDKVAISNPGRFSRLAIDVAKRNPRPGYFLNIVANAMEQRMRFNSAERLYRQAIATMPQLSEPRSALGMLYMHMGKTEEAAKLLDEAFEADPFHIRVSNMRKVAKLLKTYEAISTEHFVIHVDNEHDKILGRYMAEYLEEIYPELVKQFGYEPQQRTQFEIYHNANGLTAHEWFSARMIGLPWIQTIGASTGMIVALASPTAAETPYNWARVVKHEFVHIITLQQTGFNIPHWFTEALAVQAEGYERPEVWDRLLLERVPQGNLRTLENLNEGFTRPETPLDWQFAYCQSRLYAQYLVEKFGSDAIPRLLDQYRQNVPTERAIPQVCGVDLATFEAGYRKYLDTIVASLGGADGETGEARSLEDLEKAHGELPDDLKIAGQYARALLASDKKKEARALAEQIVKKNPAEASAALVLADLEIVAENFDTAGSYLEAALDRERPHKKVLAKLAGIKLRAKDFEAAKTLCELGREKFPHEADFLHGLAAIYKKLDETEKFKTVLIDLTRRDADDLAPRKQLAQIALAEKNYADVVKYATQLLQIDVMDVETHRLLAEAFRDSGQIERAIREYETSVTLDPKDLDLAVALARCLISADRKSDARSRLQEVLKSHADNKEARELLETLK